MNNYYTTISNNLDNYFWSITYTNSNINLIY